MVTVDSVDVGSSDELEESDLASSAHHGIAHRDNLRHRNIDRANPVDRREAPDRLSGFEQHSPVVACGFAHRPRLPLVGFPVEIELIGEPRTSLFGRDTSERSKSGEARESPPLETFTIKNRCGGAQHETVDPLGMATPHQLGDRAAHRVADGDESVDSQCVSDQHSIVGTILQPKPLFGAQTGSVTSMVVCHDAIALGEWFVALEPVQVGGGGPSVEQENDGSVDTTERTDGNRAEVADFDELPKRKFRSDDVIFSDVIFRDVIFMDVIWRNIVEPNGVDIVGFRQRNTGVGVGLAQCDSTFNTLTVSEPFGAS